MSPREKFNSGFPPPTKGSDLESSLYHEGHHLLFQLITWVTTEEAVEAKWHRSTSLKSVFSPPMCVQEKANGFIQKSRPSLGTLLVPPCSTLSPSPVPSDHPPPDRPTRGAVLRPWGSESHFEGMSRRPLHHAPVLGRHRQDDLTARGGGTGGRESSRSWKKNEVNTPGNASQRKGGSVRTKEKKIL